ncbi:hypothetical protein DSM112329_02486 [Paraconexibacter sp. AEG42_29]|uniref:PucR family transcriptional regulator n=1 Tax=Paraconexibacter sp. AEG42_29 TaxID=2997339 RepID=A0AAU7AVA7_9ACTN
MDDLEALLAADLDTALPAYSGAVMARIQAELPDLVADPDVEAAARAGTESLLREFATVLRLGLTGGFVTPPQSLAYGRRVARAGLPLAQMLRSYRLGQATMFARAAELADRHGVADPGTAIVRIGALSFSFADSAMTDVTAEYERERDAHLRSAFARRDATIAALLAGTVTDVAAAEATLGHRLQTAHRAVVAWRPADADGEDLREVLRDALGQAGVPRPLLFGDGPAVTAWLHPGRPVDWEGLTRTVAVAGAQLAAGEEADGVAGFVRSRQQAELARSVAGRGAVRRPLTHYADVALAARLTRDPAAARAFAVDELGGLSAPTPAMAQLRTTVGVYLAAGHDRTRTASLLGIHRNTVARRLARAGDLLGHDLTTRAREVEAALVVVDAL